MNPTAYKIAATALALLLPTAAHAQAPGAPELDVLERVIIKEDRGRRTSASIRVYGDGKVQTWGGRVESPAHLVRTTRATPAELEALERALEAANLREVPNTLSSGESPRSSLTVTYRGSGRTRQIVWTRGKGTELDARLEPVNLALDAILDRLDGRTLRGVVMTHGRQVALVVGGERVRLSPPRFARFLRKFDGREVVVGGGPDLIGPGLGFFAHALVSPVRKEITGRVSVSKDREVSLVGGTPATTYAAAGPGADLARRFAAGAEVTAMAYVFEARERRGTPAFLVRIQATVLEDSPLRLGEKVVHDARRGERVWLKRVNAGTRAVVDFQWQAGGRHFPGVIPLSKLRVGNPVKASAQRAASRGLTDHLGATTKRP